MVNFGTQNLQEYNMSNFSSLLASIKGGTSVGGKKGSTGIITKASQDLSSIQKLISSLGDVSGELGKEFVELETSRGKGQTLGSLLTGGAAFLLSGGNPWATAAGAGLGGYAGGHIATRKDVSDIMRQKREKERLLANVKDTWFHSSKREGTQKTGRDIDRYISSANTQLKDRLFKNALLDAAGAFIGAGKFNKWDPKGIGSSYGDFMRSTDPEGNPLGVFGGMKAYSTAAGSKAKMLAEASAAAASAVSAPKAVGKPLSSLLDLGQSYNVNYADAREAWEEMGFDDKGNRLLSITDFYKQMNLPGQGFGEWFDASK